MRARWARLLVACGLASAACAASPLVASAHPLGNFTINQYSGLRIHGDAIEVHLVLDMAEIPTAQLLYGMGADEQALLSDAAQRNYRSSQCATLSSGVHLSLDGRALGLGVRRTSLSFPPGAAGLHTTRLTCDLVTTTPLSAADHTITYVDGNLADRLGWREITATSDDVRLLSSDVPARSVSGGLTSYPVDLLSSPLDVRSASLRVVAGTGAGGNAGEGSGPSSILPRGVDDFTSRFTGLVARQDLTLGFGIVALFLAVLLGAVHAFAPGHGKTIMAAYLVGQRGSLRQAGVIGASVTATHTLGVLALGIVLSVATTFTPTRLYPVLGTVSGLLVVGIGLSLLRRSLAARRRAQHSHTADVEHSGASQPGSHSHALSEHSHGGVAHSHHLPSPGAPVGWKSLVAVGFAGGLVPSPSALVVLLGAIALHRAWFGVVLVIAYGLGMAITLGGTGLALQYARGYLDRRLAERRPVFSRLPLAGRALAILPVASALLIVLVGLGLTLRGAVAL